MATRSLEALNLGHRPVRKHNFTRCASLRLEGTLGVKVLTTLNAVTSVNTLNPKP